MYWAFYSTTTYFTGNYPAHCDPINIEFSDRHSDRRLGTIADPLFRFTNTDNITLNDGFYVTKSHDFNSDDLYAPLPHYSGNRNAFTSIPISKFEKGTRLKNKKERHVHKLVAKKWVLRITWDMANITGMMYAGWESRGQYWYAFMTHLPFRLVRSAGRLRRNSARASFQNSRGFSKALTCLHWCNRPQ